MQLHTLLHTLLFLFKDVAKKCNDQSTLHEGTIGEAIACNRVGHSIMKSGQNFYGLMHNCAHCPDIALNLLLCLCRY